MKAAKCAVTASRQFFLIGMRKLARQQQGTRVVVDAVPMRAVRHGMDGMLQHAGAVAERQKVSGRYFRKVLFSAPRMVELDRHHGGRAGPRMQILEAGKIASCRLRPGHRPPFGESTRPHGVSAHVVGQQSGDLSGHRRQRR